VVLWAYWPSMNGPFLFDDNFLPFAVSNISTQPLSAFLHGQRPLLMATYWLSARLSPDDTWWYHFLNVLIHCVTTVLVFFIVRRLLKWANIGESRRGSAGRFRGGAVSAASRADRSRVVHGRPLGRAQRDAGILGIYGVPVPARRSASWKTAAAVLLLFGAALSAKEDTIALPALLLLTDFWWSKGSRWEGVRRNWKIYVPMARPRRAEWRFSGISSPTPPPPDSASKSSPGISISSPSGAPFSFTWESFSGQPT
jgi:protein O-mannosyl-transferase